MTLWLHVSRLFDLKHQAISKTIFSAKTRILKFSNQKITSIEPERLSEPDPPLLPVPERDRKGIFSYYFRVEES